MSTVEIKLSRSNRIYRPSEPLQGKIVIKSSSSIFHYGIHLTVNGSANLQVRGGSAGVVESLYGVIKPIKILKKSQEIRTSGRIGSGTTEVPFSMNLKQHGEENLERFYETFHGADINIQVADGDVCRNMTLPIYVILPRLLTCPTVLAGPFSVEFKVSVVISFRSELSKLHKKSDPTTPRLWLAMETLPLELVRTN
ncbi:vacuolar protein sorting-associated protein 26 [Citrus sinensis]|uniref:Vacuolar protein sorting-associated protein 26 n=1 Tax=Citrus sinensis TaxID=2711 RepID=A0ACB8NWJ0_CITSI|nr:vacuolar protein sorting-associated protein 26 [Citrus sinensis]